VVDAGGRQDAEAGRDDGGPLDASEETRDATTDDAGLPRLIALRVAAAKDPDGSDGSPIRLVPSFSPGIHDYSVRCAAGIQALTISMTASRGSSSVLLQPTPSPSLPEQTFSLSMSEGQALVAAATNGTATTEYWIRCLPHDMPRLTWIPHPEAGTPPPGYYLVGNAFLSPGDSGYAMVLDGNGVPVWYVRAPAGLGLANLDVLSPGTVSFIPAAYQKNPEKPYEIVQLRPLSATFVESGYSTDTHDLRLLPNGDYLVLTSQRRYGFDLTGIDLILADGGTEPLGLGTPIQDDAILEVTPDGTVVWSWWATDHFDPVTDTRYPLQEGTAPDGGPIVSPFHLNSIDVDPTNGNLLISARHMDSVFYLDRSTGTVLWKMGGAASSKDNAAYVSVTDPFFRQHDARLQPGWSPNCNGGAGQISLFDDETSMAAPARGIVYDVVIRSGRGTTADGGCGDGGAEAGGDAGTTTVAWSYRALANSAGMGSFRISADGSRVIGWGMSGASGDVFTEVDLDGNDLLDLKFPVGDVSYRAIKVPLATFDLGTLRNTAGLSY
jgi:hypothetical protein